MLTLILLYQCVTKSADSTNAFTQAELKEEVYIDLSRGFPRRDDKDVLYKLGNSLNEFKLVLLCEGKNKQFRVNL